MALAAEEAAAAADDVAAADAVAVFLLHLVTVAEAAAEAVAEEPLEPALLSVLPVLPLDSSWPLLEKLEKP